MIASLSGVVASVGLTNAVIEVGGVGIQVQLPARTAIELRVGNVAHLHTSLIVREDSLTLFGFESAGARDFFELLQTVSGIGPKVAQSALSVLGERELMSAIATGNASVLEKIPGLGKKGSARVVLELKEKVGAMPQSAGSQVTSGGWRVSLTSALMNLGYTARDAESAANSVSDEIGADVSNKPIAEILKVALQSRGRSL
jgi:Holliday junction DNA helicase RuvA